ncbi:MAG TPA: hypothetical protein VK801_17315 [Caulobacteraceae bacterium]|jgi:hypothetical protein|nr:hypothetical protein [Caulobacteraceae bacterium]
MSRYDDDWNRESQRARRQTGEKGPRGSFLFTLALLVVLSTLCVATLNLLGYQLM